ncbi:sensor histidine kinase [Streptomyces cavernicola]|uniref:histidine kinase n=1 Tax=Streptomyces cavernicola TaxID=3043613 RepID=A0ABT6SGK0_9ACTN|nr:histidine kinase [Streptomyces sp. B-S-A6]MDI3406984.1 histidine kinase [Streptomyces sp. B-S-A6]
MAELPPGRTARTSTGPLWWPSRRAAVLDVLLALCSAALVLLDLRGVFPGLPVPLRALQLLVVTAGAGLLLVRRTRPALLTVGALVVLLLGSDWLIPFALYALGRYEGIGRRSAWLTGVAYAVTALSSVLPGEQLGGSTDWWLEAAVALALVAVPLLLGAYLRTRHRLVAQLRERAEQLERERHLLAAQALAEERARMAREMHDVVAHQIGLVVVYSNVLQTAADDDPAQLREIGQRMGDSGRKALAELREVISVLRAAGTDPAPGGAAAHGGLPALRALVQESRDVGLPVGLRMDGAERPLPAPVAHTVFRLVQEALSNARKHARGAATEVCVAYGTAEVAVVVRNAAPASGGATAFEALPGSGHGLVGMRERVAECGGAFTAGATADGGYEVRAALPYAEGPERPRL